VKGHEVANRFIYLICDFHQNNFLLNLFPPNFKKALPRFYDCSVTSVVIVVVVDDVIVVVDDDVARKKRKKKKRFKGKKCNVKCFWLARYVTTKLWITFSLFSFSFRRGKSE